MKKRMTAGCLRRHSMATMVALAWSAGSAHAILIDTGNPDVDVRFDNTLRLTGGWRAKAIDPALARNPNFDESDSRFGRGDMVSQRIDLFSELDFIYKKSYGLRLSGALWGDGAYGSQVGSYPGIFASSSGRAPYSQLTSYTNGQYSNFTKRYYRGPSGEVLDAFAFGGFNLGGTRLDVKVGQHSIYWGEGLFFGQTSIAYSQNPIDGRKAAANPGIETKEVFLPTPQLSFQAQLSQDLTFAGQAYAKWAPNRLPEGGTFLAPADPFFAGPQRLFTGNFAPGNTPIFLSRAIDKEPGASGNFGFNLRYAARELGTGTTFGLYYRKFDERQAYPTPLTTPARPAPIQGGLSAGTYGLVYNEGVQMLAGSFTTQVADLSVAGELGMRKDTALVNSGFARDGTGPRGNIGFANLNAIKTFGPTPLFDTASLTAEVAFARLTSVTRNPTLFNGVGYAGCPSGDKNVGCATKNFGIVGLSFAPQWLSVFPGANLTVPISFQYGIKGNNPGLGGGSEGQRVFSIGLQLDYQQNHQFTLRYAGSRYRTKAPNAAGFITAGNGPFAYNDRDWVSFIYKYGF